MTSAIVTLRDVRIAYDRRTVLSDVNLDIEDRAITALVGPSGCGKSSLLAAINRMTDLVSTCRVAGSIRFDGRDVLDERCDVVALRRQIGSIAQQPNPFPFSILRNVELALKYHGVRDAEARRARAERALRDVGLWDEVHMRLGEPASHLSGGQQQRLCIARALALEPRVLLLDEPCSALDPAASGVIEDLMVDLAGRLAIVVVTHNLAQARRIADRVAVCWSRQGVGTVVESGSTGQIFDHPESPVTAEYVQGLRG